MPPKTPKLPKPPKKLPSQKPRKGATAGEHTIAAKAQTAHHTGVEVIDVTGKGRAIEFNPEEAVLVIRAQTAYRELDRAAETSEALATTAREAAERARVEIAKASDQALATDKLKTLEDHAQKAKERANSLREQAETAYRNLEEIEVKTGAVEREEAIQRAIAEAEERVAIIARERRAEEIIEKLEQYTLDHQQAIRERAQASERIHEAQKHLAQAQRDALRPGADPQKAAEAIAAAQQVLDTANRAHEQLVNTVYRRSNSNIQAWKRNAKEFLTHPESSILDPDQLNALNAALEMADNAAAAVATPKAGQGVSQTITRLQTVTADFDRAAFELQKARRSKLEADEALAVAERAGDGIDAARTKVEQAAQALRVAETEHAAKQQLYVSWRRRTEALLNKADNLADQHLLEVALGEARPTLSWPEQMLDAAADFDRACAELTEAHRRWRDAVREANASADPGVELAAQTLRDAKNKYNEANHRVLALQTAIREALDNPHLPQAERGPLQAALEAVNEVRNNREVTYVSDQLAESRIKRDESFSAKEEALKNLEKAQDELKYAQETGADVEAAQGRVDALKEAYEATKGHYYNDSHNVSRWEERYHALIPTEESAALNVNEQAVTLTARLEETLARRSEFISARDRAYAARIAADAQVRRLEVAGNQMDLPAAKEAAEAARREHQRAISALGSVDHTVRDLEARAQALLKDFQNDFIEGANRVALENALNKIASKGRDVTIGDCLNAIVALQEINYQAVARAQKTVQEARDFLQMARETLEEGTLEVAQAELKQALIALKEAEDHLHVSSSNVSKLESQARELLDSLPVSERQPIQDAINGVERVKAQYEVQYTQGQLAEKRAQVQEAIEVRREAKKALDEAQANFNNAESEPGGNLNQARENLEIAQRRYEATDRDYDAKRAIAQVWARKLAAIGGGAAAVAVALTPDETAAANPLREEKERARHWAEAEKAKAQIIPNARLLEQYTGVQLREANEGLKKALVLAALPEAGAVQYMAVVKTAEQVMKAQRAHQWAKDYYLEVRLNPKREAILDEKLNQHPNLAYWLKEYPAVRQQDEEKINELWEMIGGNQAPSNADLAEGSVGQVSLDGTGLAGLVQLAELRSHFASLARHHATPDPLHNPRLAPILSEIASENLKAANEMRDEDELNEMATGRFPNAVVIPEPPSPKTSESETKKLDGVKAKEKAWALLEKAEQIPASQNYTPNVWESPNVNYSGDDGAYETAMSVEQSMTPISPQPTPKV